MGSSTWKRQGIREVPVVVLQRASSPWSRFGSKVRLQHCTGHLVLFPCLGQQLLHGSPAAAGCSIGSRQTQHVGQLAALEGHRRAAGWVCMQQHCQTVAKVLCCCLLIACCMPGTCQRIVRRTQQQVIRVQMLLPQAQALTEVANRPCCCCCRCRSLLSWRGSRILPPLQLV